MFVLSYRFGIIIKLPKTFSSMENLKKLEMMDKILRELEDLKNSQTAVLKKLTQIEADNITLGVGLLEKKLPDLHEEIDSSVVIVSGLLEEFQAHRDDFYTKNNLAICRILLHKKKFKQKNDWQ